MINEIDNNIGADRIKLLHLNDTLDERGSKKDRHYHIGKGKIGEKGFSFILKTPVFRYLPFILETPKKSTDDDYENLLTVRRLWNGIH